MFDQVLRQLVEGRSKKKKPAARKTDPVALPAAVVHPDAPAADAGPGFTATPGPRGFSDPFDPFAVGSPAARFDEGPLNAGEASGFDVPLDRAVADRSAPKKKSQRSDSRLPERLPQVAAARAIVHDRTENVDEVKKAMEAPELQATMGQRVLGEEAARAAKRGDRLGLRQALAGLVQKLNVSSPKDAAVLLKQEVGLQTGGQLRGLLAQGKATLDSTPGGRLFAKISPMIRDYAPVDMKGEVDGALGGLAERFAMGAQGKVDVVMGAAPAAAQGGAVGGFDAPAAAAGGGGGDAAGAAVRGGGGLGVFEVGSEPQPGVAAGGGQAPPSGGAALKIGEVTPSEAGNIGPGLPGKKTIGEVNPDGKVSVTMGTPSEPYSQIPVGVGESADQSQRITPASGMAPPGSINVSTTEMPGDTARRVVPQAGMAPPGSVNVGAVEMPADTPRGIVPGPGMASPGSINVGAVEMPSTTPQNAVVQQAGRSVVAGQLTLKQVLEQNPNITEVNLQQVAPSGKGSALKSIGSLARNALLQRLGAGGGVGGTAD